MSKKELINRGRNIALHMKINPDQDYWYETLNELCDALEDHEPKPDIRKGEVYAYLYTGSVHGWFYTSAVKDMAILSDPKVQIRKLSTDEIPLPEES